MGFSVEGLGRVKTNKQTYILYPYLQKFHKITLFFKEIIFFGNVTKELFRILSFYIGSLKEDIHNLFLYLTKNAFCKAKVP
jgi:hypothetical protein